MAIIDRYILTCRNLFKKIFVKNDNYYWLDSMYKVERNFNGSYNSWINDIPMKIWNGKKLVLEPVRYVEKLEIDDDVRVLLNKNQFEKKTYSNVEFKNL